MYGPSVSVGSKKEMVMDQTTRARGKENRGVIEASAPDPLMELSLGHRQPRPGRKPDEEIGTPACLYHF